MSQSVELIPGPPVGTITRESAEKSLRRFSSAIAAGAPYALEQLDGRWVAAVIHDSTQKQAAPFGGPPPGPPGAGGPPPGGPPADDDEEAAGPKSEGPDDTAPDDGPPSPDDGGDSDSDGPPKDKKGGEKAEISQLFDLVGQIAQALGIPTPSAGDDAGLGPDDGLGGPPGPDGGPPGAGGPPPGPPGAGGPPGAPPHGGPGGPGAADQRIIHEKALKPGEVPPGGTPIGAPAFASVRADHPFAHLAGTVMSHDVSSKIGDRPLPEVEAELQSLASEVGARVVNFGEARDSDGDRVAIATITRH